MPFSVFCAASRPAAHFNRLRELPKLNVRVIRISQFARQRLKLRRHFAKEIEHQRTAVEQLLRIHQYRRQIPLNQKLRARIRRLSAVFLQPRRQEVILDGHSAKDGPISASYRRFITRRGQHLAKFQAPSRPHDDFGTARKSRGIDRRKTADRAKCSDANKVMLNHITILPESSARAKVISPCPNPPADDTKSLDSRPF